MKGGVATLDARAVSNSAIEYQWYFNDEVIDGETGSVLSITPANTEHEGIYHVVATSAGGSTASEESEILVTDKRLYNIATRARVGTGANVLIAGFVVIGPDPKEILIRGIGPSLIDNGIDDPLLKPRLEIYNAASELIYSNEGWATNEDPDAILAASQLVGAGGRDLHDDDTALLVTLEQGLYTAIVRGQDNSTGVALVEAFEIEENFTRMINLSSPGFSRDRGRRGHSGIRSAGRFTQSSFDPGGRSGPCKSRNCWISSQSHNHHLRHCRNSCRIQRRMAQPLGSLRDY